MLRVAARVTSDELPHAYEARSEMRLLAKRPDLQQSE
jgi:hypothetical protein